MEVGKESNPFRSGKSLRTNKFSVFRWEVLRLKSLEMRETTKQRCKIETRKVESIVCQRAHGKMKGREIEARTIETERDRDAVTGRETHLSVVWFENI